MQHFKMSMSSFNISAIIILDSLTCLGQQQNKKEYILTFGYFKMCSNNVNLLLKLFIESLFFKFQVDAA